MPKIIDWYIENKINIDTPATHTMPLEDINKSFDLAKVGKSIGGAVLFYRRGANWPCVSS